MAIDLNKSAADVIKATEKLSDVERAELIDAERAGKNRATVLEALGTQKDPEGTIRSGTGRILGEQEADPKVAARANLGSLRVKAQQELAEAEAEIGVPEAGPVGSGGGTTPAGTGAAPAPATAPAGTGVTGVGSATTGGLGV